MYFKRCAMLAMAAVFITSSTTWAEDNAAIKGAIKWGIKKTKKGKKLDTSADPYCAQLYSQKPLRSERLVFNDNRTIQYVFVYVDSGLPDGRKWDVPTEPVVLDQKGCHYEPHVFGVMAGQEITIRNSDDTAHNVNASPKNNQGFNQGQPKKGMEFNKKFNNAELMVPFKCDVHPWMSAHCAVMEHPFFATSDQTGAFEITGLPAGTYTLKTWAEHKMLKPQEIEVTVGAGETKEIEITFAPPKK